MTSTICSKIEENSQTAPAQVTTPYSSRLRPLPLKTSMYRLRKPIENRFGYLAIAHHHEKRIEHLNEGNHCKACLEGCVIRVKTCACCIFIPFHVCSCGLYLINTALMGTCSLLPATCYGISKICACPEECQEPAQRTASYCCQLFGLNLKSLGCFSLNLALDVLTWPLNIVAPEIFYGGCNQVSCQEFFQHQMDKTFEEIEQIKNNDQ